MNFQSAINVVASFLIVLLVACAPQGGGILKPAPPPPCQTADVCAQLVIVSDALCKVGESERGKKLWQLKNLHPSKAIYVTYSKTERVINSTAMPTEEIAIIGIKANSEINLGCYLIQDKKDDAKIYEYSYSVLAACFADECPSAKPSPPSQRRDPKVTCEALCAASDTGCFKAVIPVSDPISKNLTKELDTFVNRLQNSSPPATIDITSLANISNTFTGTNACWRDSFFIGAFSVTGSMSDIKNIGGTCSIGFELPAPKDTILQIVFPPDWRGTFSKSSTEFFIVAQDFRYTPSISITTLGGNTEADPVSLITKTRRVGQPTTLTFTGKTAYCAEVVWSNPDVSLKKRINDQPKNIP